MLIAFLPFHPLQILAQTLAQRLARGRIVKRLPLAINGRNTS